MVILDREVAQGGTDGRTLVAIPRKVRGDLENWRFGRVPNLERVIHCNLEKAERILRLLRFHAEARGLKPSRTYYRRWGKGPKQELRF
jgi:hypothetical protein